MNDKNSFQVRSAKNRSARFEHLTRLSNTLNFAARRFLELELTVEHCRTALNHPVRQSDKKTLSVQWALVPSGCPELGPSSLRFHERIAGTNRRTPIKRLTAPKLATLTNPYFLPLQEAAAEELFRVERERQQYRRAFAALMKATKFKSFSPESEFNSALDKVCRHREYMVSSMKSALIDGGRRLNDLDADLDQHIRAFNNATYRENGSVMCRFEPDGRTIERYIGPRGPSFFSMFPNHHTGQRYIRRIDHSRKRDGIPITVDLLRTAGYRKRISEIVALAQPIIELRTHRNAIADKIVNIAKGFRLITHLELHS
jgi:hypothetical protein